MTVTRFERMRLLVIEDQPETRQMLRSMLMEMGIVDIAEAENGRTGLDTLVHAVDPVDVVLCDWNLPLLSGIDVLKRARNHHLSMPFLMVTARNDRNSIAEAAAAGVSAYLHKPFSMDQLEAKLRTVFYKANPLPPVSPLKK